MSTQMQFIENPVRQKLYPHLSITQTSGCEQTLLILGVASCNRLIQNNSFCRHAFAVNKFPQCSPLISTHMVPLASFLLASTGARQRASASREFKKIIHAKYNFSLLDSCHVVTQIKQATIIRQRPHYGREKRRAQHRDTHTIIYGSSMRAHISFLCWVMRRALHTSSTKQLPVAPDNDFFQSHAEWLFVSFVAR